MQCDEIVPLAVVRFVRCMADFLINTRTHKYIKNGNADDEGDR